MKWLPFILLLCGVTFAVQGLRAQPSQLPSIIDDAEEQRQYIQNTVLKPGEKPEEKIRSNIFIKTTVSKTTCFIGEPLLVMYELYVGIPCNSRTTKQPSFTGCSIVEMTTDEPGHNEKVNGRTYRVRLVRKVQIAALQEGDLIIPEAAVNNEVDFSTIDNPFNTKNYEAEVYSKPVTVHVKPFATNKPADFKGIIGNYTINAKVENETVPLGENDRLRIAIDGSGNIEAVSEPAIAWPQGIQHFDATDSQHIDKVDFPVSGNKTYDIFFIATKEGKTIIPPIEFTYFNTTSQAFETISTKPITVTVTAALPAKKDEQIKSEYIGNRQFLWFVPGIALVVLVVWFFTAKKQPKQAVVPAVAATQPIAASLIIEEKATIERPDFSILLAALSEVEDNHLFFTNARTLLTSALQHLLNTKDNNEAVLIEKFTQQTGESNIAKEMKSIYTLCNQSLYSPLVNDSARQGLIDSLGTIINQLEKT